MIKESLTIDGFIKCRFCNDMCPTNRAHKNHIIYCKKNPNRKERKIRKEIVINKELYNFTLEYIKSHKYINSNKLAKAYYSMKEKPDASKTYRFARIIMALLKENLIEKYNGKNYIKIDKK